VNTNAINSSSGQLTDQQVLKQLAAQGASGSDFMYQMQMKRNDDLKVQTDKLFTIINDSKKSDEEVKKAYEQLDKIQQNQQKTQDIEEALGKQFRNVIVTQDGNKYRVTVQSDKLERSQSVSIIDLVMNQLKVTADKVEVTRIQ
jgi:stage III sporulation protein AH